jgi:hypothetical protein
MSTAKCSANVEVWRHRFWDIERGFTLDVRDKRHVGGQWVAEFKPHLFFPHVSVSPNSKNVYVLIANWVVTSEINEPNGDRLTETDSVRAEKKQQYDVRNLLFASRVPDCI